MLFTKINNFDCPKISAKMLYYYLYNKRFIYNIIINSNLIYFTININSHFKLLIIIEYSTTDERIDTCLLDINDAHTSNDLLGYNIPYKSFYSDTMMGAVDDVIKHIDELLLISL